ncbi:MAG: glycosyltransferase family 2 protein [Bacteroidota bacterium]
MKVSIIITSWNTKHLLQACLRSIRSHTPAFPFETIVVDNGSRDASAEMVEREFPEVQLIKSAINTGYAGGNNIGFKHSQGEYVLLLGSDTEVLQGTIHCMAEYLEARPEVGIVSCRMESPDGSLQHSCKQFPTVANAVAMYCSLHFLNKEYLMWGFDHTIEREVDQPDATCVMIRRTAMEQQIFDERFSILYNDVDLCQRVKRKGWKIMYIPSVKIIHHGSQSTKQAPPNVRLVMYQNILLYYQTYFGTAARILLSPILFFRYLLATRSFTGLSLFYSLHKARLS